VFGKEEVLDRYIPRHWNQRGLSWGGTAVIWLAYILTDSDHRKVSVQEYIGFPLKAGQFYKPAKLFVDYYFGNQALLNSLILWSVPP
jgi:transposase